MEELTINILCKAKTKNNTWVTGYYLELGNNG